MTPLIADRAAPSALRAWLALVSMSFQRQARARQMVWIALGLLALAAAVVAINTARTRFSGLAHWESSNEGLPTFSRKAGWGMFHWRYPVRQGPAIDEWNHDG